MKDDPTPLEQLYASLTRLGASHDEHAAADELCDLLVGSFGSTPKQAVSRSEHAAVLDAVRKLASSIGAPALREACARHAVPVPLAHWLLAAAAPDRCFVAGAGGDAVAMSDDTALGALSEITATVETMRLEGDDLVIDIRVAPTSLFDGAVSYEVQTPGAAMALHPTGEYAGWRLFGHEFVAGAHLRAVCPAVGAGTMTGDIAFRVRWDHGGPPFIATLPLEFGPYSHLTAGAGMGWNAGASRLTAGSRSIGVTSRSAVGSLGAEAALIARMLLSRSRTERLAGLTRAAFWVSRPLFSRQNIWLTHDKMYSAGDNGEYMYRYLAAHRAGFTPYYAINRDASEVARLRADGVRLVHPGTLLHRLVYLNSRVVLTTQANPLAYNGLGGKPGALLRDLFNARIVCIQHGLSMQDIASFMHRSHAGIERYYCASRHEIDNLAQPAYGYDADQLVLTGVPRFDGLRSDRQRRVLIAPTWRPEFSGAIAAMNKPRPAASHFENSPFLALYARLLTDDRLLQCARETGYAIDFLLHPYVAANSPAFAEGLSEATASAGVEVQALVPGGETPYEVLLERSDLLVTDYSGVQYDFAYMGKPVVYFHPPVLPPQYGHGAMDYETMGFGEIATDVDGLVRVVCSYLRRDCAITPQYESRVDDFFAYRDGDNCARILADLAPYAARYVSISTR